MSATVTKVKRPTVIAEFLRAHPVEDRHQVANELMLIGYRHLQQQREEARHQRQVEVAPSPTAGARGERRLKKRGSPRLASSPTRTTEHRHTHHAAAAAAQGHSGSAAFRRESESTQPTSSSRGVFGEVVDLRSPSPPRRASSRATKRQEQQQQRNAVNTAWFCSMDGDVDERIPAAAERAKRSAGPASASAAPAVTSAHHHHHQHQQRPRFGHLTSDDDEAPAQEGVFPFRASSVEGVHHSLHKSNRPQAIIHEDHGLLSDGDVVTSGPTTTVSPAVNSHTTSDDPFLLMSPSDRTPEEPPLLKRHATAVPMPPSGGAAAATGAPSAGACLYRSPNSDFVVVSNSTVSPLHETRPAIPYFPIEALPPASAEATTTEGGQSAPPAWGGDYFGDSGSTRVVASGTSGGTATPPLFRGLARQRFSALEAVFACAGIRSYSPSVSRQSSIQTTPSFQPAFTIASSEHFATPRSMLSDSERVPKFDPILRKLIEISRGARLTVHAVLAEVPTDPVFHDDILRRYNELLLQYHMGHAKAAASGKGQ